MSLGLTLYFVTVPTILQLLVGNGNPPTRKSWSYRILTLRPSTLLLGQHLLHSCTYGVEVSVPSTCSWIWIINFLTNLSSFSLFREGLQANANLLVNIQGQEDAALMEIETENNYTVTFVNGIPACHEFELSSLRIMLNSYLIPKLIRRIAAFHQIWYLDIEPF